MLVKVKKEYGDKFDKFIYKILQFTREKNSTYAIIIPFKSDKWDDVDYTIRGNWHTIDTKRFYSVDIDYLEFITDSEIPEDVKRDIKIDKLLS
jgi:hypothetical protein